MGFTVNQVRHFYIANKVNEAITEGPSRKHLDETAVPGEMQTQINKEKDHLYFEFNEPKGIVRSDIIKLSKISYIKVTAKEALRTPLKVWELNFENAPAKITSEVLAVIRFKQFLSMGEEDTQSLIAAHVPKKSGDDVSDVLKNLAFQLAKSAQKSFSGFVKVLLDTTEITSKTALKDLTGTYTKIVIEELPQPWQKGHNNHYGLNFDVRTIVDENADFEFVAKKLPEDRTTKFVPNGMKIADMEWFYKGARGDYYRMAGYPYVIHQEYLVDPSKEYYTLDIHYAHADEGISTYHSEKDITIASEDCDSLVAIANKIKEEAEAKHFYINIFNTEK